jgi:hypothetical protein
MQTNQYWLWTFFFSSSYSEFIELNVWGKSWHQNKYLVSLCSKFQVISFGKDRFFWVMRWRVSWFDGLLIYLILGALGIKKQGSPKIPAIKSKEERVQNKETWMIKNGASQGSNLGPTLPQTQNPQTPTTPTP